MKKQIIYIGGGDSYNSQEAFLQSLEQREMWDLPSDSEYKSWKSWLVNELGSEWYIDMPQMPNKQNAKYDEWKIWFKRHLSVVEGEVILIGLSLGAMFLAKYLTENDIAQPVPALFLLAGPSGTFTDPEATGNDCASFAFDNVALAALPQKVGHVCVMHSQDDSVVPYSEALLYKDMMPDAELVTMDGKDHMLVGELPELLERIQKLVA